MTVPFRETQGHALKDLCDQWQNWDGKAVLFHLVRLSIFPDEETKAHGSKTILQGYIISLKNKKIIVKIYQVKTSRISLTYFPPVPFF